MKIKPGFKIRTLGKEYLIVGDGIENINFNKVIALNETAAYLWNSVTGKEFDAEKLAGLLRERYEVDADRAISDSVAIAKAWVEAGIVEE